MTNEHREKMWSAYLDGELSASEAAQFDESLTHGQREQLAAEMRMESALVEALSRNAACPDEVWLRTLQNVQGKAKRKRAPLRRWFYGVAALAAAVTLVIVTVVSRQVPVQPSFLALNSSELTDLSASDGGMDAVQRYLHDRGVNVRFQPFESLKLNGHVGARTMGVREVDYQREPVYEVFYECCGQPLKLVLARKGSAAAARIDEAIGRDVQLQAARDVGEFRAALLGGHHAKGLLDQIEVGDVHTS